MTTRKPMTATDAVLLFDERARAALVLEGKRDTRAEVCRVLGVTSGHYSAYMTGRKKGWDTVVDWLDRWREAGKPALGVLIAVHISRGFA